MHLAPYSPIRFGVNNEAVNEDKLCLAALKKEIFVTVETSVFHLNISKTQLDSVNNRIEIIIVGKFKILTLIEVRNSELFKT